MCYYVFVCRACVIVMYVGEFTVWRVTCQSLTTVMFACYRVVSVLCQCRPVLAARVQVCHFSAARHCECV